MIANVAFWVLGAVNPVLLSYLTFNPYLILHGQVWRLVSFMLYPAGTSLIAFIAFYFYYYIGNTIEQYWGTAEFNIYFFLGVLLTIIYGFIIYFVTGININLDSQFIYLSMFFAFASLFPDMQVLFMFIIPIKMKYLALVDAAFFALSVFNNPFPINLLPIVAVLNFIVFCGKDLKFAMPKKQSKSTINFKRESARIRKEQEHKLYNHKCSVCGRTDVDYPNLEFRYCSRCAGYHCFCEDHINNHIHFTE